MEPLINSLEADLR